MTDQEQLQVLLTLKDEMSASLKRINNTIDKMGQKTKQAQTTMRRAWDKMTAGPRKLLTAIKKVNKALFSFKRMLAATIVGGALATFFYKAVKAAADFQYKMQSVGAVASATASEMKKLIKAARDVGKSTMFTAQQVADVQYFLASAGLRTRQIIETTRAVITLATAQGYDPGATSALLASTMSMFSMTAKQSTRIINVFAAAIANSQATMEKLINSMRYVGPVAAAAGYSLEQTTAGLMMLYNAGLRGEQAGTTLRMVILRLIRPMRRGAQSLFELGIATRDVAGNMLSLPRIMDQFKAKLDQYVKEKKYAKFLELVSKIFGAEAVAGAISMIRQGGDAYREWWAQISGTNEAMKQHDARLKSFTGKIRLLISAYQDVLIAIGNVIINNKEVGRVIEWVKTKLVNFVDYLKNNKDAADAFTSAVARAFKAMLKVVAAVVKAIIKAIISVVKSVKKIADALDVTGRIERGFNRSLNYVHRDVRKRLGITMPGLPDVTGRAAPSKSNLDKTIGNLNQTLRDLTKIFNQVGRGATAEAARGEYGYGIPRSAWKYLDIATREAYAPAAAPPERPKARGKGGAKTPSFGSMQSVSDLMKKANEASMAAARDHAAAWTKVRDLQIQAADSASERATLGYEKTKEQMAKAAEEIRKRIGYIPRAAEEAMAKITDTARVLSSDDMWAGFRLGMRQASGEVETWAQAGADLAKTTAEAMGNSFKTLFFDMMEGRFKKLTDYVKAFFAAIAQALMNRLVAQFVGSLFSVGGTASTNAQMQNFYEGYQVINPNPTAKGGIMVGGFHPDRIKQFAQGAPIITGPTLGWVGEGRYNEAVVPLPDGRSIPVDVRGGSTGGQIIIQNNIKMENQTGLPLKIEQLSQQNNGPNQRQVIVGVMLDVSRNDPQIRRAFNLSG